MSTAALRAPPGQQSPPLAPAAPSSAEALGVSEPMGDTALSVHPTSHHGPQGQGLGVAGRCSET